ncbi:MAG: hypoxanthine phosphoribosyltransferase [Verrucomicrobia bacterium]|nr:hypoxanthine phosphoribosyltransferase [Verrucomicrobiota bacterium]
MPSRRTHPDVERVLISEARIHRRVAELAREVTHAYLNTELSVVGVLNGSIVFLGELLHRLPMPTRLDSVVASSYRAGTVSRGPVEIYRDFRLPLRGRHVLVVDDILDTGKTLSLICKHIRQHRPASLRTCVLLDKPARRLVPFQADFVGFKIPDAFVVGYGLDFAERYRNLPCIAVLKPQLYPHPR